MKIERPLDLLNDSKGSLVLLQLKNGKSISGKLLAFDININIVLDNAKELENGETKTSLGLCFIRGDSVIYISPTS
jgi:small nuclear ribonucleoprotein (snRNP)-like protein